jgi:hypothetical protein
MEPDCSRTYNIAGSVSDLQAIGITARTYVPPIDNTSDGLRKWLYDSGLFIGARGDVSAPSYLSNANAYYVMDFGYSFLKTTTNCVASGESEANCIKRNTISRIGYMQNTAQTGVFLAHNESEFNASQWDAMLDAVQQSGIQIMTLAELANYIKTYDPSDDLATTDGMTYTRTLVDEADYHLSASSPAINAGTDLGLTTDIEGNPIYGLPDIGAYEYQPPYESGTDEIDLGAGARIYGDGKFENINSTTGTTGSLSIDPEGSDTTKYLDVSISTWNTSGTYQKTWTESSTTLGATNTLHTIGDLQPNTAYTIKIDGTQATGDNLTGDNCTSGVCTSSAEGVIIFTYTGGYSEHTFDITDTTPPVLTITSPETGDTVSADDTITFTDSETTNPQCFLNYRERDVHHKERN